jgi:drug/metabolite transporter (DMT)-like permease
MHQKENAERSGGRLRPDAVLLAVTIVWGSSFVVVRHALDTAPPLGLLFWRFAFATGVAGVALVLLRRPRPRGFGRDALVLGSLLAVGMTLQVIGQAETTATKAALLTGLAVVLTPLVAVVRTRRLPTLENGMGITLASLGFVLLTLPPRGSPWQAGDLWVAACGTVFAFYGVELAERAGRHDTLWLTAAMLALVTVAAGAAWLLLRAGPLSHLPVAALESGPIPWSGSFPLSVAYLGSLCTLAAFLGWTWSQGRMSAIHGAIILALEPVVASLLAAWLLGERIGARGIGGALLVLLGIVVSELRIRGR